MPNWCYNKLTVSSEDEYKIKCFLFENKENNDQLIDFNKICQLPKELEIDNNDENTKKKLLKKYGSDNWYDWCNTNWGSKWNASDTEIDMEDNKITYIFFTPWGPPREWFMKLINKYTNLEIQLNYEEPGCDFAGFLSYTEGDFTEESYELSTYIWEKCNKDIVKKAIIQEVNDYKSYMTDSHEENVSNITDNIIDTLSDDIENSSAIYDKISEIISKLLLS